MHNHLKLTVSACYHALPLKLAVVPGHVVEVSCTKERHVRALGLVDTTAAVEAAHGSEPLRRLQHKDSRHVKKALPLFWMY